MAARRQPSTTSLSKYYRAGATDYSNRTSDFCNNFWGPNDSGVDVLFARMRGAIRTMDELRNFWKERASIEEDYAKRLLKLSKSTLGRDEVGDLRSSLDTILLETERQSTFHLTLSTQIKSDLEHQVSLFCSKQGHHKKVYTSPIEKSYRQKTTQESYVTKAREKYEQDCMRINSYTAQSTLVQGRDLEKIHYKLERAQQTVRENERDFANFARAFKDTAAKWESDWKTYCDTCQDLEEDRMEFMKDNMWAYANAVSTVCVSDDESCEKVRVSLEQVDTLKEMENFVVDFGTGNQIQAPPQFINFNSPDAQTSMNPTMRPANFVRSSQREKSPMAQMRDIPAAEDTEDEAMINTAGRGAGNRNSGSGSGVIEPSLSRQPTTNGKLVGNLNGHSPSGSVASGSAHSPRPGTSPQPTSQPTSPTKALTQQHNIARKPTTRVSPPTVPADPLAEPIDPNAETYIKVGSNAYKVDLSRDPAAASSSSSRPGTRPGTSHSNYASGTDTDDPLARQLAELTSAVAGQGSVRRQQSQSAKWASTATANVNANVPSSSRRNTGTMETLPPPQAQISPTRDYRNSADMVVGPPPPLQQPMQSSRSASPQPPTAAFMQPPSQPPSEVQGVMADYHQSLPGERKAASRRGSFISVSEQQTGGSTLSRPSSQGQGGYAGVGAGSRSPSPSPGAMVRRSPSPQPGQYMVHQNRMSQPPQQVQRSPSPSPGQYMASGPGHQSQGSFGRAQTVSVNRLSQQQPQVQRNPSPSPGGYMSHSPSSAGHSANPSISNVSRAQSLSANRLSQQQAPVQRAASPNQVGIALDPSGRVLHDEMAQRYQAQQQPTYQQPPPQQPYQQQQPPPPAQIPAQPQQTYRSQTTIQPQMMNIPPPPPLSAPPTQMQQAQVQRRTSYAAPNQAPAQGGYQQPQMTGYASQPQHQHQQQATYTQPGYQAQHQAQYQYAQQTGYGQQSHGSYYQQQQPQQYGGHQLRPQQTSGYSQRSPSPQPGMGMGSNGGGGGQYTEDGSVILFYVQAMYDYEATIDEEFSFQAGDVIAVTATPEDGWWSGELLDEERRQPGRHVFPSNFVRLF
ncbi:sh3 domain-containing protein [Moniliophthora roreri]|uniref:Cell division control protein n=1 Tax=Moniliophthora roreri TaxID=221103 RepID=A0A0W0FQL0_MONRR|nr:sh3 domain-containing protein [Moniliophthora roreri]